MRRSESKHFSKRLKRLRRRGSRKKVQSVKAITFSNFGFFTGLKVLKSSGILDAYQGLLVSLCKYGLPTEDLYEFSALTILKHEKKLKVARKKELEERLKQRND